MKVLVSVALLSSVLFGQILYEEHFTGGGMDLTWSPWVVDTMEVINDPTTPGGDSWAGSIANDSAPIAAAYAGELTMTDYTVDAQIYMVVSAVMAPYNGICTRMNVGMNSCYTLVSDFDSDARLRLRVLVGATPTVIRDWTGGEIPGGVPVTSSWHKFKLTMIGDSIWAYYDDILLADCPFYDVTISDGAFGIYLFGVAGPATTKCDDIIVTAEGTGISENSNYSVQNFAVFPNPFQNQTQIVFGVESGQKSVVSLKIYDASGRLVRQFNHSTSQSFNQVAWDGRDADGNTLPAGVYLITAEPTNAMTKVVKLR